MSERAQRLIPLHPERTERIALTLTGSTMLALYHYCLAHEADASKMARAASGIVTAFLSRDASLKRWRAAQGESLPGTVVRRPKRGGRRA